MMAASGSTRRAHLVERDPAAPPKPGRNPPPITRVPSDSHTKRLSTQSEFDERVSACMLRVAGLEGE